MWYSLLASVDFQPPQIDFYQLIPVLVLGLLVAVSLCLELRDDEASDGGEEQSTKPAILGVGALALVSLVAYYFSWPKDSLGFTFNEMLVNDGLSRASGLLIVICCLLATLAGPDELERYKNKRGGEFCALLFSASLGMVLMSSAVNTIVLFLGLELFSLALYLLCIYLPDQTPSRESGMKYFLLSSAASAVLLYGLALLYGATGTTWLLEMRHTLLKGNSGLLLGATVLTLCGLLFKLAAVPFHFWAPDVYDGAPTTVTAFMSVATKVAALATLWRMITFLSLQNGKLIIVILFSLCMLSIIVGNMLALAQSKVKRMLAYSGVANAGYLLIAPALGGELLKPMMFFLATYLVGNMGAFLALAQIENYKNKEIERVDLKGLYQEKPWLASAFCLSLLSLAGLPPAAGFMGKFYLFGKAIAEGQLILPVIAIAGSLIGAAYYLNAAVTLFAKGDDDASSKAEAIPVSATSHAALFICVLGIIALGFFPSGFLAWL